MSQFNAYVRRTVLIDHESPLMWEEVTARRETNPWKHWIGSFMCMFKPYTTVFAPPGTDCAVTTLDGKPLYQYKIRNGKVYELGMQPSPGFPGS